MGRDRLRTIPGNEVEMAENLKKWFATRRTIPIRWAAVMGLLFGPGMSQPFAQVVINEVMFDPEGSEFFDEYVELYNTGQRAVDLSGWRIGDGDDTDGILPMGEGTLLPPFGYALVLDADYSANSTTYDPLPQGVLLLTIDGPTFGRAGLSNSQDERVMLLSANGDTVSQMTYRAPNVAGFSEEKVDPGGGDGADNWVDALWPGGTPGRVNGVSSKAQDISLRAEIDTLVVGWRQPGQLTVWAINLGSASSPQFSVQFSGLEEGPWLGVIPRC